MNGPVKASLEYTPDEPAEAPLTLERGDMILPPDPTRWRDQRDGLILTPDQNTATWLELRCNKELETLPCRQFEQDGTCTFEVCSFSHTADRP